MGSVSDIYQSVMPLHCS